MLYSLLQGAWEKIIWDHILRFQILESKMVETKQKWKDGPQNNGTNGISRLLEGIRENQRYQSIARARIFPNNQNQRHWCTITSQKDELLKNKSGRLRIFQPTSSQEISQISSNSWPKWSPTPNFQGSFFSTTKLLRPNRQIGRTQKMRNRPNFLPGRFFFQYQCQWQKHFRITSFWSASKN